MRKFVVAAVLMMAPALVQAEPPEELVSELRNSMVKVHVAARNGGRGLGSGVVVDPYHVATNCHVLAHARGVSVTKLGQNHIPVGLKADWKHDLCLLRFDTLPIKPVALGNVEDLQYEQPVFSIGYPMGSARPLVTYGKIKALYPLDDSQIIRASSSFRLGASGSAMMDENGRLIGINTFKSPGRNSYFYSVPVTWIKKLLASSNETQSLSPQQLPFWDAPEEMRPYFMRVVPHLLGERWQELSKSARNWTKAEPANAEAWYYLGLAEARLGNEDQAIAYYHKTLDLNPQHSDALLESGLVAWRKGNLEEVNRVAMILNGLNADAAEELRKVATTVAN